jgi:phosphotransferase system enzyme I (PtsP)
MFTRFICHELAMSSSFFDARASRRVGPSHAVVFRTFDLGDNKILPNSDRPLEREENPAVGWRALAWIAPPCFGASEGRPLTVMFPMVAEGAELDRAREIFGLELECMQKRSMTPIPKEVRVGVMIEAPSRAVQLAGRADFVSIGTNDLARYFFANPRTSSRLANRYDTLAPRFLQLLRQIRGQCEAAGVPVAICGDMAANPLEAVCLAGLGFRALSLPASAFGGFKKALRSLDCAQLRPISVFECRSLVPRRRSALRSRSWVFLLSICN